MTEPPPHASPVRRALLAAAIPAAAGVVVVVAAGPVRWWSLALVGLVATASAAVQLRKAGTGAAARPPEAGGDGQERAPFVVRVMARSNLDQTVPPSSTTGPEPTFVPVTGYSVIVELVFFGEDELEVDGFRAEVLERGPLESEGVRVAARPGPHLVLSADLEEPYREAVESYEPLEAPHFEVLLDTEPPVVRPALAPSGRSLRPVPQMPMTSRFGDHSRFLLAPITDDRGLVTWRLDLLCTYRGAPYEVPCGVFTVTGDTGFRTYKPMDQYRPGETSEESRTPVAEIAPDHWQVRFDHPRDDRPRRALALFDEAAARFGDGKTAEAVAACRAAADLYREMAEDDRTWFEPLLAATLNNLGGYLQAAGDPEAALAAGEEAVDAYRRLRAIDPTEHEPVLADAMVNLANLLGQAGRWDEAAGLAEEAVGIYRGLAEGGAGQDPWTPKLGLALSVVAWCAARSRRRVPEGLAAAREAAQILRPLANAAPDWFAGDLQFAEEMAADLEQ